jgi:hypothetical protein
MSSFNGITANYYAIDNMTSTTTVVSGSGARVITLLGYVLNANNATMTAQWIELDGSDNTTARSGELHFLSGSTISAESNWGVLSCASGSSLQLLVSGSGGSFNGHLAYTVRLGSETAS